jgi:hypothetical protein
MDFPKHTLFKNDRSRTATLSIFPMRITTLEKNLFIKLSRLHFGQTVHCYLFGSRVNDLKKGGDIDLYIEASTPVNMQKKLNFLVDVEKQVTSRKVDLIVNTPESGYRDIFTTARETGILLC